jgi:hypothetical protein
MLVERHLERLKGSATPKEERTVAIFSLAINQWSALKQTQRET